MLLWLKKFVGRAELSKPLPHSKPLQDFCKAFDAYPEPSDRKFYRQTRLDFVDYDRPEIDYKVETVEAVALHIPIYRLPDFLSIVDEQKYKELEIRDNVPAVKKAYEHYRMLLKMCGGDF
jgi:hypothetical protein